MLKKKLLSGILLLSLLLSGAISSVCAQTPTDPEITPIVTWTMDELSKSGSGGNMRSIVTDSLGSGTKMVGYYGSTASLANVGKSIYASQKALYNSGGCYNYIENADGAQPEAILNAFDTEFTFETWIKFTQDSVSSIFGVYNTKALVGHLSTSPIKDGSGNSTGMQSLVFRRKFETGEKYWEISERVVQNQWTHIVLSYDAQNINNEPFILVNGVRANATNVSNSAQGNALACTPGLTSLQMGLSYHDNGTNQFINNAYFGRTSFYSGIMTEAAALESYNIQKGDYETDFDVKILDSIGNIITKDNLNSLSRFDNRIKIDFSGADKSTVNNENVYIASTADNKWINFETSWNGDTYVISGFDLMADGEYNLVIKDIKDTDDDYVREIPQVVKFKCDPQTAPFEPLAIWDMEEYELRTVGGQSSAFMADSSDNNVLLRGYYGNRVKSGTIGNSIYGKNYIYQDGENYSVYMVNKYNPTENTYTAPESVLNALDDKFTFETWVRFTDSSDNGALFNVLDSNRKFIAQLSASVDQTGAGLVFRRQFDSGDTDESTISGVYWVTTQKVPLNTWVHVVLSYDSSSPANTPVIMLNGENITGNDLFVSQGNPATGEPIKHNSTHALEVGRVFDGSYQPYDNINFAKIAFYKGNALQSGAMAMYDGQKGVYETEFVVEIKDMFETVIPKTGLKTIKSQGNSISIDFTGVERSTVTGDNVYIQDLTSNSKVLCQTRWDGDSYVLRGFSLIDKHKYKLVIKNIYDSNLKLIREMPQEIIFSCDDVSNLTNISKWGDIPADFSYNTEVWGKWGPLSNSFDESKYTLEVTAFNSLDKLENVTYYPEKYVVTSSNAAHGVPASENLAQRLDGPITYETWIKPTLNKSSSGLFAIGSAGNDHTDSWMGSNGNLTFIRKFTTTQGYWVFNDANIKSGQWNHIVLSYDPSSVNNTPILYVNGVRSVDINAVTRPAGTAILSTSLSNPVVKVCCTLYNNANFRMNGQWSMSAFYGGMASEYEAISKYNSSKSDYEMPYEIKLYNMQNEMYSRENLSIVENSSYITINMSEVNTEEISGKIILINKLSGASTELVGTVDGNGIYTSDINLDYGSYKLVISKDLKNPAGGFIRTTDYTLDFAVAESKFEVLGLDFYDEYNNKITQITSAMALKPKAEILNTAGETVNTMVIMAVYSSNNELLDITSGKLAVTKNAEPVWVEGNKYLNVDENSIVKIMLWNDDLMPLFVK